MNYHRHLLAYAATTLLLLGCAESEIITEEPHPSDVQSIGFSIDVSQDWYAQKPATRAILEQSQPRHIEMKCSDGSTAYLLETTRTGIEGKLGDTSGSPLLEEMEGALDTRGTLIGEDRTGMGSFSSFCYKGSDGSALYANDQTSNTGALSSQRHWPDTESSLSFYAVHPYDAATAHFSAPASGDGLKYNFTLNPTVASQADLMYASTGSFACDAATVKQTVPLRFKHALTAVRFKLGEKPNFGRTIKSISLKNVYTQGTLTLPNTSTSVTTDASAVWTPTGEKTGTITLDDIGFDANSDSYSGNVIKKSDNEEYFLMIPQDLAGVVIEVVFTDGTKLSGTLSSGQWKAGTTVDYALSDDRDNWEYILTVSSPSVAEYKSTDTDIYSIVSYRESEGSQHPVGWTVTKYEHSDDNGVTWIDDGTSMPSWLNSLSKTSGNGGVTAETGTAEIIPSITDHKAARDNLLKTATPKSNYDLSQGGETANCYVISAPGTYKIPLIYGNARNADGTVNDTCFNKRPFVDSKDEPLDQIYIKDVTSSTLGGLAWTDIPCENVATDSVVTFGSDARLAVDEENGFLLFTVNKDNLAQGNAVVGIYNMNDNKKEYLWSWHLWFAPDSVLEIDPFPNHDGLIQRFTKEPLGMAYDASDFSNYSVPRMVRVTVTQKGSYNTSSFIIAQNPGAAYSIHTTFYQWGRKDAFPGTKRNYLDEGTGTVYGDFCPAERSVTYGESIKQPYYLHFGTHDAYYNYHRHWWRGDYGETKVNAWCADLTSSNFDVDKKTVKTVYDPCPVGFRMPRKSAFTGLTVSGENVSTYSADLSTATYVVGDDTDFQNNQGWRFARTDNGISYSVFFPATGFRSDGHLEYFGEYGFYWCAVPETSNYGYCCCIDPRFIAPLGNWGHDNSGFMVRPVKE
jgi:hypothetical protein